MDLALNNLQRLICHKTQQTKPKLSDDEAPVSEFSEIWSIFLLPSLPGLLWSIVVAPDRVLSMGETELFDI